jgi:hypothetical protein
MTVTLHVHNGTDNLFHVCDNQITVLNLILFSLVLAVVCATLCKCIVVPARFVNPSLSSQNRDLRVRLQPNTQRKYNLTQ